MPSAGARNSSRREFFLSLSRRARVTLVVAVFLIFSGIVLIPGFAGLYPSKPWWSWAVMSAFGGAVAVGYAMSSMWSLRLLFVVIPVSALFPPVFFTWLFQFSGIPSTRPSAQTGALVAVIACMLLICVGYAVFIAFIQGEAAQKIRLGAELSLAQKIHRSLVPPIDARVALPSGRSIEVFGRSEPSSEMGGDLIDLVRHSDGSADLFLADVSGHGVSAGVVMGMVKSAIRTRLMRRSPLGELISDVNAVLESLTEPHMFATLACLRVHADGRVEHVIAGHPPAFHIVAATGETRALASESLPLGIDAGEAFPARSITPASGDLLALYTDGLTEAAAPDGRQFGIEGVRRTVSGLRSRPLAEIAEGLVAASRAHGPQGDDQSVLLIRFGSIDGS